jgi:glycosyltransferase involved in cell wall biosynthesis
VRVAVYNRYWTTAGGAERYAGAVAQTLAAEHDVDLLTPEPVDWAKLEERLGLDLSAARPVFVEDAGYGTLAAASSGYDLLVNCSYMSNGQSTARHAIYVVLFPSGWDDDLPAAKQVAARVLRRVAAGDRYRLEWGRGFHLPESATLRTYRWTSGDAQLLVWAPAGETVPVRLTFARRPAGVAETRVEIESGGEVLASCTVGRSSRTVEARLAITGAGEEEPVRIGIRSDPFVPKETLGTGDVRELGVKLRAVRLGSSARSVVRARFPGLTSPPPSLDFLDTYDRIVSISEFTRSWVHRLWGRESDLLYPPVEPIPAAPKEPVVLAVGRFFGEHAGHSKKQLELVKAFRRLAQPGWELHLVGGCSPEHRSYLERVRREARGLPVVFHVDAPGAELRDLYGRASVFWHATGLDEDEHRRPHRLEHFGISTVEAMSAGAVPVVIDRAGQREIVENGVSGLLFRTLGELVDGTRRLIADGALRERLSLGAIERAQAFDTARFEERLRELVAGVAEPRSTHDRDTRAR